MLEVIKELIPLVEGATNGAMWLVLAYFGMIILKSLCWIGMIITLAVMGYKIAIKSMGQIVGDSEDFFVVDDIRVLGTKELRKEFIKAAITDRSDILSTNEIQQAIAKLKSP